jgi:hypothetical protein
MTIILTINTSVDTSVIQNGATLTANTATATYKWLDCNNGYAVIPGAVQQVFHPTANGSYALLISKGGCTDTSSCHFVQNVGLSEVGVQSTFSVYPNPCTSSALLKIAYGSGLKKYAIALSDISGKEFFRNENLEAANFKLDFSGLASGVYIVAVIAENAVYRERVVKQ